MDFNDIMNAALPVVYVAVGAVLIWFIIELVMTVRKARKTVDVLQKQLEPTLTHVENITRALEPASAKVDPLVERVSLAVDAANLEIMRVDQILEDVSGITDSVSNAVDAVDAAANAPLELMNTVTGKLRAVLKPRRASDESVALGEGKAESDAQAQAAATGKGVAVQSAQQCVTEQPSDQASQKNSSAAKTVGVQGASAVSTESLFASEIGAEKYFTYAPSDDKDTTAAGSQGVEGGVSSSQNAPKDEQIG